MRTRLLALVALAVGCLFLVSGVESYFAHKVSSKAETVAKVDEKKAQDHADQAAIIDARLPAIQDQLDNAKEALAKLSSEREVLLKKLAESKKVLPSLPQVTTPTVTTDPRDEVIVSDAKVIENQKLVIAQQDSKIVLLTTSRDEWKAAFNDEQRRATGLQIALDAQKRVSVSGKWVWRLQGLAVGFGAGYVAGRLH